MMRSDRVWNVCISLVSEFYLLNMKKALTNTVENGIKHVD
jgi:hypothetical protein